MPGVCRRKGSFSTVLRRHTLLTSGTPDHQHRGQAGQARPPRTRHHAAPGVLDAVATERETDPSARMNHNGPEDAPSPEKLPATYAVSPSTSASTTDPETRERERRGTRHRGRKQGDQHGPHRGESPDAPIRSFSVPIDLRGAVEVHTELREQPPMGAQAPAEVLPIALA